MQAIFCLYAVSGHCLASFVENSKRPSGRFIRISEVVYRIALLFSRKPPSNPVYLNLAFQLLEFGIAGN